MKYIADSYMGEEIKFVCMIAILYKTIREQAYSRKLTFFKW